MSAYATSLIESDHASVVEEALRLHDELAAANAELHIRRQRCDTCLDVRDLRDKLSAAQVENARLQAAILHYGGTLEKIMTTYGAIPGDWRHFFEDLRVAITPDSKEVK